MKFTYIELCVCVCVCVCILTPVWPIVTPWTVGHRPPLSMEFCSKNAGMGCYFLVQGILLTKGSNTHTLPASPALTGRFFTTKPPGQPQNFLYCSFNIILMSIVSLKISPYFITDSGNFSLLWKSSSFSTLPFYFSYF